MAFARSHIQSIIEVLTEIGSKRFDIERLDAAARKIEIICGSKVERSKFTNKAAAYDRLFGFGDNARHYLCRGSETSQGKKAKITLRHIKHIDAGLKALGLVEILPSFGSEAESWGPFLEAAQIAVRHAADPNVPKEQAFIAELDAQPEHPAANFLVRLPNHFFGRDADLAAILLGLENRAEGRPSVVILHGLSGVGKTVLAHAAAAALAPRCHAIWLVDAASSSSIEFGLRGLALAVGWSKPSSHTTIMDIVIKWSEYPHKILVIFENALNVRSLQRYLPSTGNSLILICSNSHAWRHVGRPIEIKAWTRDHGRQFLLARTGIDDQQGANGLTDALEGLPLAHEMAAAYCEYYQISFDQYLERFTRSPLEYLSDDAHLPSDYRPSIAKAFELAIVGALKLHPAAQLLLTHLSVLPDLPIPLDLLSDPDFAFCRTYHDLLGEHGVEKAISALRSFSLVEQSEDADEDFTDVIGKRVFIVLLRLHRLVKAFFVNRICDDEREKAKALFLKSVLDFFSRRRHSQGNSILFENIQARYVFPLSYMIVRQSYRPAAMPVETASLLAHLGDVSLSTIRNELYDEAIQLLRSGTPQNLASMLTRVARRMYELRDFGKACTYCKEALSLWKKLHPLRYHEHFDAHVLMASIYYELGQLDQALPLFKSAKIVGNRLLKAGRCTEDYLKPLLISSHMVHLSKIGSWRSI